jgi:hypothetical protein
MSTRDACRIGRRRVAGAASVATLTLNHSGTPLILAGGEEPQAEGVALTQFPSAERYNAQSLATWPWSGVTLHPRELAGLVAALTLKLFGHKP